MAAPSPLFQGASQPEYRDFGIDRIDTDGLRVPVATGVLHQTPFYTLRSFRCTDRDAAATLLVVPPLSGQFPVLMRDVVLGLVADVRVAVLDWANVRHVALAHGSFGFDDNIAAISDAAALLGPGLAVLGLCQAAVPALAAVADIAAHRPAAAPRALVLVAAPVDPLAAPTPVVRLIRRYPLSWYQTVPLGQVSADHDGRGRAVYPAEVQLKSLTRFLVRQTRGATELAQKVAHDDGADPDGFPFLDLYTSIMDLDARHFVENIDRVFLSRSLAHGAMLVADRPVELRAITETALLTVEGGRDTVAAPGQTGAAHVLCSGLRSELQANMVFGECGHFGLFHGTLWRRRILPVVRDFCLRHLRNGPLH